MPINPQQGGVPNVAASLPIVKGFSDDALRFLSSNPFPFSQVDWPVVYQNPTLIADQLGFVDMACSSQDKFFGAAGMGPSYDWPNPIRRKHQSVAPSVAERVIVDVAILPFSQDNWYNSTRRYQPIQDHIDPSETWLFAQLPYPFYSSNWQNPSRRYQQIQDHIDPSETWLLKDSMYGAAGQVPSYDWPNPRGPKPVVADYIDPSETWLLKDTFFGPAGMGPTYDWTNPSRGRYAPVLDHIDPAETWLLKDTFFGAPGQVPSYDWPNPRGPKTVVADYIDPSETWLLKDTFFGPAGMGPSYDWPNPVRAKPAPIGYTGHIESYKINLYQIVFAPFYQNDWPVVPKKPLLIADQIGFLDMSLFAQDQFFGTPGQVPSYDWPNPVRAKPAPVGYAGHIETYKINLYQIVYVPFHQNDWANPSRGAQGLKADQLGYVDPSEIWMLKDTFFGPAGMGPTYDWPNPQRVKPRSEYGTTDFYKVLLFIAPPAPFYQENWTNPTGPRSLIGDQLGYTDASEFWMLKDLVPFNRSDWNNPVLSKPASVNYAGHIETYKINLYQIVFVPFYQTDWQNPVRAQRPLTGDQLGYIDPSEFQFLRDTFFGAPGQVQAFDWSNPVRAKPAPVSYAGHNVAYQINLFQAFQPFIQTDWSNPLRQKSINLDQSITSYNINTLLPPFGQIDWPNPLRSRSINLDRLVTSYNINALAPPFVQIDWQNPRGALRTPSHFTYYDFYKINLLNLSNAPSGRLRDWPNPSLGQRRNVGNYGWLARQQIIPGNFGLPDVGQLLLSTFTPMVTQDSAHHWRRIISLQGNMVLINNKTGEVDTGQSLLGNVVPKKTLEGE